jgi:ribosomal protein S18 acetylase RimI-like enzyme
VNVRLARRGECEAISTVLRAAFALYCSRYTCDGYAATTPRAEQIRHRWNEGPVWVATIGGTVVGTVGAVVKPDGLYVRSMAVHPNAEGRGVARALLEMLEHFALQHRCPRLYLSTTPFLDRAIALYERFGFTRTTAPPHDLDGTPLFTMEKRLLHG